MLRGPRAACNESSSGPPVSIIAPVVAVVVVLILVALIWWLCSRKRRRDNDPYNAGGGFHRDSDLETGPDPMQPQPVQSQAPQQSRYNDGRQSEQAPSYGGRDYSVGRERPGEGAYPYRSSPERNGVSNGGGDVRDVPPAAVPAAPGVSVQRTGADRRPRERDTNGGDRYEDARESRAATVSSAQPSGAGTELQVRAPCMIAPTSHPQLRSQRTPRL